MADVKWVKVTTDMFENRKLRYLRRLPEGNDMALIWVMLLTIAGRCNDGGRLYLTERMPYTTRLLAEELSFPESTVAEAIQAMLSLDMLTRPEPESLAIAGWNEYQSGDKLEQIREQNRARKAAQRERQRAESEAENGHDASRDVTRKNKKKKKETDQEAEQEQETLAVGAAPEGGKAGKRFEPPTEDEVAAYCQERRNGISAQEFVDFYAAKGWMIGKNRMQDWRAAVRTWECNGRERLASATPRVREPRTVSEQQYTQRPYSHSEAELDAMMAAWQASQQGV